MEYELKQNPTPDEWAVLIWKRVDGRKELDGCAIFKGRECYKRAIDYRNLMVAIQASVASKGDICKSSAQTK